MAFRTRSHSVCVDLSVHGKTVVKSRWSLNPEIAYTRFYCVCACVSNAGVRAGVAGLVVDDQDQILVIKDKYARQPAWKLPGGMMDPGRDSCQLPAPYHTLLSLISVICNNDVHVMLGYSQPAEMTRH